MSRDLLRTQRIHVVGFSYLGIVDMYLQLIIYVCFVHTKTMEEIYDRPISI